ncbi:BrnT family toxin [Microbacterium sp.]|uniref:BrnT family toxin n=1 Tax=Microbacterium sp. TaxID=51671 RepID=UPI003F9B50FA
MEFEFDPTKSTANLNKHGIDFTEAQRLWLDEDRIEVRAHTEGEPRWLTVAKHGGRHWTAVHTFRNDRIRIISVRRSRQSEVDLYED